MVCFARGGPEGARRRKLLCFVRGGPIGAWWWRHTVIRGWTGRGCGGGRGVFPWTFPWLGRQDAYVARFPVGIPNLQRGGNGGAA